MLHASRCSARAQAARPAGLRARAPSSLPRLPSRGRQCRPCNATNGDEPAAPDGAPKPAERFTETVGTSGGDDPIDFKVDFEPIVPAYELQAAADEDEAPTAVQKFLFPDKEELPDDFELPIWDHLEELRERVLMAGLAALIAVVGCFCFSKELVLFLEAPVADAGVRFLQLSPGEFFFTTFKVAGYSGLLLAAPTVLYEIIAYVVPGLTKAERTFLAPVVFGSSILFYFGLVFSYEILTPAALNFFVSYADGAVESLWSIDQYFQFVLVLMLSTGLSFQVPVIQVMLGQLGIVSSEQMFSLWRYVVVGSTVVAAVLTPSTDPFTQALLAIPLVGLYFGGAAAVRLLEQRKAAAAS
ncbi:MAG: TatC-like sec-independent protein translocon subunit [Monoraphidium minutum]|nr:MAG: TatC-like sec-independent protein translocon subunit [Monoraphidium minutum]